MTYQPKFIEAAGELYGRAILEWVGKTPDSPCPEYVKARILLRQSRKCALTGVVIRPGDKTHADHRKRLKDGGLNVESNIQIVRVAPHIEKTAQENSDGSKEDRVRRKHLGLWPKSKAKIKSRGFEKRGFQ